MLVGLGVDVQERVKMRVQALPERGEFRPAGTVCLRLHARDDKKQGVPNSGIPSKIEGAQCFDRIRGYLSTCRKQGISLWDACFQAALGQPFLPTLPESWIAMLWPCKSHERDTGASVGLLTV